MTKIIEYYNPDSRKFVYEALEYIESNEFREACFSDYCAVVMRVNHIIKNGKKITKGYTKPD